VTQETTRFYRLFSRRERWGLSRRGALLLLVILAGSVAAVFAWLHPFLAVTDRIPARILVMEGWLHPSGVEQVAHEFRSGGYDYIITTGGPFPENRGIPGDSNTWADSGAYWLRQTGLSRALIHSAPSHVNDRDRTFSSAVALRRWLVQNVATEGVHARRTRLLFETALAGQVSVGIIAIPNRDYDGKRWWRYSEGVREVLGETIAYLYARLVFNASNNTEK
jgi:hypothetical protein